MELLIIAIRFWFQRYYIQYTTYINYRIKTIHIKFLSAAHIIINESYQDLLMGLLSISSYDIATMHFKLVIVRNREKLKYTEDHFNRIAR